MKVKAGDELQSINAMNDFNNNFKISYISGGNYSNLTHIVE